MTDVSAIDQQKILNVTVQNKRAYGDGTVIVCRNSDYRVHFDFDEEWDAYVTKVMVIRYPDNSYDEVAFTGTDVNLPVIYNQSKIIIGVYAGDIRTTTGAYFRCRLSVNDGITEQAERPEDVVAQILDLIEKGAIDKPYVSLERQKSYLYKVTFDTIPSEIPSTTVSLGACSSFVRDGKLYRNLDWGYTESPSFHVICKGFEGMAFDNTIVDSVKLDPIKVGQLPYRIVDGCNDYGIRVATHILFNDWQWSGTGSTPLQKVPYLLLTRLKTLDNLDVQISDILGDLYAPQTLVDLEYLAQFIITDGTRTYIISPPTSSSGPFVIQDATNNPKLTNFRWVPDEIVDRTDLQIRPTGVERWNSINDSTTLADLRFTKAYEEPARLSEFIGIDDTTKDSSDTVLTSIYNKAHAAYQSRTRDGTTWQTMHSVVYSANGMEELYVQEKYEVIN